MNTKVFLLQDDKGEQLETFSLDQHLVSLLRTEVAASLFKLRYGETIKVIGYNQQHYTITAMGYVENKKPTGV